MTQEIGLALLGQLGGAAAGHFAQRAVAEIKNNLVRSVVPILVERGAERGVEKGAEHLLRSGERKMHQWDSVHALRNELHRRRIQHDDSLARAEEAWWSFPFGRYLVSRDPFDLMSPGEHFVYDHLLRPTGG